MSNSVDYHAWQSGAISIAGARYRYATKPGAFAHGAVDPAQLLLAQYARVSAGDTVLQLNCGNGLFGAVAATTGQASRVLLSDRNVVSHDAAVRTLEANGAACAQLHPCSRLLEFTSARVCCALEPTARANESLSRAA